MARPLLACAALMLVACAPATSSRPVSPTAAPPVPTAALTAREVIAAMKDYEARVGFAPTGNFTTTTTEAFPGRCYYTGTLELPESYRGLRVVAAVDGRCPVDASQFDVFPYALETAATGRAAVTPALAGATLERLLMVVPHEDFHNQPEAQRAPPSLAEAAAMLAGFVTAAGFARDRFGAETSPEHAIVQHLEAEADLFARKAGIVNGYFDEVAALYAAYRATRDVDNAAVAQDAPGAQDAAVTHDAALERKRVLFRELQQACLGSGARPVSFNQCPAVLNNAGLAFDRTYTRDYPDVYAQAQRHGADVAAIIRGLRETLARSVPARSGP